MTSPNWLLHLIVILNTAVALASVAFAVAAVRSPEKWIRTTTATDGEHFYARMYATRALPLGLCATIAPFLGNGSATAAILVAAAVAQLGDCLLGALRRVTGMAVGGGIAAVVHLGCAIVCA